MSKNASLNNHKIRVRFAPSPTGFLHVGGLRTALYNYLFAKKNNGTFILRIEDTDRTRHVEGATENLIATLKWSGLTYDEGPEIGGPYSPYIQSQRIDIYQKYAAILLEKNFAYKCFCTPDRLEKMRMEQQQASKPPKYDQLCRKLTLQEIAQKESEGLRYVIRMKIEPGTITFSDLIRGEVSFDSDTIDDQVLLKSDGFPTYHLANVVDDHEMKISHVIRGEEWLSSTPKHILLYRYFGWELPLFAHLPLLLNPDRTKLSKRQGDVSVEDYRRLGYQKEALINFIALLGWNPGDEREIFSLKELEKEFSLERVGKSGAIFNVEKLNWLNGQHIRRTSNQELAHQLRPLLLDNNIHVSEEYLEKVIACMKERVHFLHDYITVGHYFFTDPKEYDLQAIAKRWTERTPAQLEAVCKNISDLSNFKHDDIEQSVRKTAEDLSIKTSDIIHPLRIALSGVSVGPGLFEMMEVLGKETCIRRINKAISTLVPT